MTQRYENMLFYFAYKTFIDTADDIIEKHGMSRQHHRFLFFINQLPGITIKQLLETLEISKQGSHGALKKLREKGLILIKESEKDKRVKILFPTEEGKELINTLSKAQDDLLRETFDSVGGEWYDVMESLASKRNGFKYVQSIRKED